MKEKQIMRRLQLVAHGEPSDVIELKALPEPALGQEDVLISMEAAPMNPSDFLFVRGTYGIQPTFPSPLGGEGVGRVAKIGSRVNVALRGKRVLILSTYEQGTWADEVVVHVRNIVPMSDEADPLHFPRFPLPPRPTLYRGARLTSAYTWHADGWARNGALFAWGTMLTVQWF